MEGKLCCLEVYSDFSDAADGQLDAGGGAFALIRFQSFVVASGVELQGYNTAYDGKQSKSAAVDSSFARKESR